MQPITSLGVLSNKARKEIKKTLGYEICSRDLNAGAGGNYIYLELTRADTGEGPVTGITVIEGGSATPPPGFTKIDKNLNAGTGRDTADLYLCTSKQPGTPIADVVVNSARDWSHAIDPPSGYIAVPVDLNKEAGGDFIYLCYKPAWAFDLAFGISEEGMNCMVSRLFEALPPKWRQGTYEVTSRRLAFDWRFEQVPRVNLSSSRGPQAFSIDLGGLHLTVRSTDSGKLDVQTELALRASITCHVRRIGGPDPRIGVFPVACQIDSEDEDPDIEYLLNDFMAPWLLDACNLFKWEVPVPKLGNVEFMDCEVVVDSDRLLVLAGASQSLRPPEGYAWPDGPFFMLLDPRTVASLVPQAQLYKAGHREADVTCGWTWGVNYEVFLNPISATVKPDSSTLHIGLNIGKNLRTGSSSNLEIKEKTWKYRLGGTVFLSLDFSCAGDRVTYDAEVQPVSIKVYSYKGSFGPADTVKKQIEGSFPPKLDQGSFLMPRFLVSTGDAQPIRVSLMAQRASNHHGLLCITGSFDVQSPIAASGLQETRT